MSSEASNSGPKKAVKGYFVNSRYKQVAETFSKGSSYSKSSFPDSKSKHVLIFNEILKLFAVYLFNKNKKLKNSTTMHSTVNTKHENKKKLTSTPEAQSSVAFPPIDASTITDASGFLCPPKKKGSQLSTTGAVFKKTMKKNTVESIKNPGSTKVSKQHKVKANQAATDLEKEIHLLYAEYLQAKLLESKTKKAMEMRSKHALERIHKVWCFMQILLRKNATAKRDLDIVTYFQTLHKHLERQEQMLLPALEMISVLESQYEKIATAVYSVQHKMGVKNIKLPDPGCEGEIVQLLENIKSSFDSILMCVTNCDEIVSKADAADMLVKQGKLVIEEIKGKAF
ncbi:uncharacterized protein CEXT_478541 [Caerostris extrusa]|uniref:Uncharacterized protein n=1 Tax=Caerostris extrusa TaxID=172846 RepID=A0AAV4Y0W2_CAEEX|nr:uncharacterized protein CEXT_478541 [Caerostris extrusa]